MDERLHLPSLMAQRLAGFGTWSWDVAADSLVWSRELYRIYGRDPAEFETRFDTFLGCIDPRDRDRVQRGIVAALESGDTFEHEERIIRPTGQIRLLRSTGRIERDDAGRPLRVTGACLDITEQRAAQVALAEREAELRLALSAAHMGTFTWWIESRKIACSSEVERLVGLRLATVDDLLSTMDSADRRRLLVLANRALRDRAGHLHLRFRTTSGPNQRWLQLAGTVELDSGQPMVKGTIADITEQAALEAQLLQAQKMESVGRLAGGVAHDFNNLLTVILAELDLLQDEHTLSSDVKDSLQGITDAALRASDLTRKLLTLAREQPIKLDHVDVSIVIREAAGLYGRVLGELIELSVNVPPTPVPVLMDPAQLEQLLLNLVTNARDAMPRGGRLSIDLIDRSGIDRPGQRRHELEAMPHIAIEVTDCGGGVSDDIVSKIFDPFFTTKDEGTGLGLSTCYGIVQRHAGVIECVPATHGGTTFRVLLPRADVTAATHSGQTSSDAHSGSETVLLVEDDAQLRRLAARMLSRQGYRVVSAPDGQAALDELDKQQGGSIDLLVTDVVMPRLGGVPLAREVQSRLPGIPVLFMSGYTADAFADGMPEGADLLRKPFMPAALAFRVRQLLDGPRCTTRPSPT